MILAKLVMYADAVDVFLAVVDIRVVNGAKHHVSSGDNRCGRIIKYQDSTYRNNSNNNEGAYSVKETRQIKKKLDVWYGRSTP